jgi:hypothetical protein
MLDNKAEIFIPAFFMPFVLVIRHEVPGKRQVSFDSRKSDSMSLVLTLFSSERIMVLASRHFFQAIHHEKRGSICNGAFFRSTCDGEIVSCVTAITNIIKPAIVAGFALILVVRYSAIYFFIG